MDIEIKPLQGVAGINFGSPIDTVRKYFGVDYKSFRRAPTSVMPCDYFEPLGVFAYYALPGLLEAIEFVLPANPGFMKINFLETPFEEIKKILLAHDPDLEQSDDGLTSYKLGIGVYAPDADENPNLPPESVIAFEKGYYDSPGSVP
jgi:hypothetical protein